MSMGAGDSFPRGAALGIRSRWEIISVLWATLAAPGPMMAQVTGTSKAPTTLPRSSPGSPAEAVGRLVEQLKRHPVRPRPTPDRFAIYLMDVTSGEATLDRRSARARPDPLRLAGLVARRPSHPLRCHAGDPVQPDPAAVDRARPGPADRDGPRSRQLSLVLAGRRSHRVPVECRWCAERRVADEGRRLGTPPARRLRDPQVVPGWPPDDDRQLRRPSPGDAHGRGSGEERRPQAPGSPDPLDPELGRQGDDRGGHRCHRGRSDRPRSMSATRPRPGSRRCCGGERTVPTSSRRTRSTRPSRGCVFVGGQAKGTSLYSVQPGKGGPAKPLGKPGDPLIVNLAFSPDGRYVLYSADGPR